MFGGSVEPAALRAKPASSETDIESASDLHSCVLGSDVAGKATLQQALLLNRGARPGVRGPRTINIFFSKDRYTFLNNLSI